MNELSKKSLKIGGILAAICGASALLITLSNVIASPIIKANEEAKISTAIDFIYPSKAALSDKIEISGGSYVTGYYNVYGDTSKSDLLGTCFAGVGSNSYGEISLLVGVSGDKTSPTLGKVYLINDEQTKKTELEDVYLDRYNNSPSTTTLANTSSGATYGAKLIKSIVEESLTYYSSL
ncbi:MAG: hypothetical protein LKF75_00630 [Bacilli bacterium]|jgi:hypothetical protein|nr:hypothetical protein [Bacilli bacterium]MCH4210262.1 hypothetical protein [Bacilli bacterium]MCH4228206.1 hypothetical protein [Bacilli bacterium]MCH4277440.1 hypothetical protein [Bacilli bacterium]MCI2054658.1 hypothetical protein [Bacilli bacterium]